MRRNPHYVTVNDCHRARKLRHEASPYEQKLWLALQQATAGTKIKFRRQQPIHPYIADFACMRVRLLIELDGISHDMRGSLDQTRDDYLRQQGYTLLRISNDEITKSLSNVVEAILAEAEKLLKEQHPLTGKNQGVTM